MVKQDDETSERLRNGLRLGLTIGIVRPRLTEWKERKDKGRTGKRMKEPTIRAHRLSFLLSWNIENHASRI